MEGVHALCMQVQYHKRLPCNDTSTLQSNLGLVVHPKSYLYNFLGPCALGLGMST